MIRIDIPGDDATGDAIYTGFDMLFSGDDHPHFNMLLIRMSIKTGKIWLSILSPKVSKITKI